MKPSYLSNLAKTTLLSVLIICRSVQLGVGQESSAQGIFRFVNATSIPGKVFLTIDTLKLRPEGFGSGDTTAAIGILAGPRKFTVMHPVGGTAQTTISVQPNISVTVIAYCKTTVDPQSRKITQALQLLARQNPPRTRGRTYQLLYVSSRPSINLTINGQVKAVSALREVTSAELPTGEIKVEYATKPIVSFSAPEAGNFLVVIFDDPTGKVSGVVVPDYG